MSSLILVAALLATFLPASRAINITVHMDGDPRCHEEETISNCTLDAGLSAAQKFTFPVTITIQPGNYTLHNNTSCVYHNRSDIQIVGQDSPVVNCLPGTGCSFYDCQNINVDDVTFIGCGAVHNSTSRNFTAKNYSVMKYQVAIYFELCFTVAITKVNVSHSNGMGLVFMASTGHISISESWFINNTVAKGTSGGGGVYIEFPKCRPGEFTCTNDTNINVFPAIYTLTSCYFVNNNATNGGFKKTHIIKSKTTSDHYVFGNGGGLLVYFKGNANNNTILLSSCEFTENQADIGAGMYVSFSDESHNNYINITTTNFTHNDCHKANILPEYPISGGGAKIHFEEHSKQNALIVHDSNFINNSAIWGGGLSVYTKGKQHSKFGTNDVLVIACHFESNIARIGAAIDFLCQLSSSKLEESLLIPVVEKCSFIRNGGMYEYTNGSEGASFGAVNVENMPVTFNGNTRFNENIGSALVIQSSNVLFANESTSTFLANNGRIGAGITLLGTSWIGVDIGTQLVFDSNTATEHGGAIYAAQAKEHYEAYSKTCFIRYSDLHTPPSDWKSFFNFSNNTASNEPNSIFASSILPCVWAASIDSTLEEDISQTFCSWKSWEFGDSNCSNEILTSAARFSKSEGYTMSVYPGLKTNLDLTVLDDLGQNVTNQTIFNVAIDTSRDRANATFQYMSDNHITIYGSQNKTTAITLQTIDNRNIYTYISVNLSICPPGFAFDSNTKSCICSALSFADFVSCNATINTAFIFVGYCISYSPVKKLGGKQTVIVSRCPFGVEKQNVNPVVPLPLNARDLDRTVCNELKREGKLCGECMKSKGLGISVFSGTFKCVKCDNFSSNLLQFFAISFLIPTLFFILIIIFHIGVTSAPANGFIFFSQIITVPIHVLLIDSAWKLIFRLKHTAHTTNEADTLTNLLFHPYRLWSLDFNRLFNANVCLNPDLKVIEVLAIRYISAICPIIVLLVAYTIIELHARNCRIIVCLWKPFCFLCVKLRRQWKAKNSIIDAFATFILLSYTKFVRVSITILTPSNVYNVSGSVVEQTVNFDPTTEYFSRDHLPYAVLAALILATFGALPPLLLLLYPFRWFQRCLSHCKLQSHALRAFVDAFQGCYKDGRNGGPDRRYFAGIYFIFRIVIFLIYTVPNSYFVLFTALQAAYVVFLLTIVILRPYKKEFYNFLDGFFFAMLAVTSATTMYMYTTLVDTKVLPEKIFYLSYCLYFIPFIYMATYLIYWLLMQSRWFQTHCIQRLKNWFQRHFDKVTVSNQALLDEEASIRTYTTSELPDRLENPDRYENTSNENGIFERSMPQWASEQTALRRPMTQPINYGTAVTY